MSKAKYFAIVPAAGSGQRFQHNLPKQFLTVHGRAIIEYALQPLLNCEAIEQVVVALSLPNPLWESLTIAKHPKISIVPGGLARSDSVLNALISLGSIARDNDWVLVHDAARPCLSAELVQKLIRTVGEHPVGGILGVPVRDTLKRVSADGQIIATVPREQLWHAQTPQQCRYGLLKKALQAAQAQAKMITDEASALELAGQAMMMVEGDIANLKLTHPQDLALVANGLAAHEERL